MTNKKDIDTEVKEELSEIINEDIDIISEEDINKALENINDEEITEESIEQEMRDADNLITIDEAIADKNKIIVKDYISFQYKQILIDDVKQSCIIEEDGITKIDYGLKIFVFEYLVVLQYSNIELPTHNYVETYDKLYSHGLVNHVLDEIGFNELINLKDVLDKEIEQALMLSNKFEVIVNKFLQDVIKKIPETKSIDKWMKNLVKSLKDFNPEKYPKLQELLSFSKGENMNGKSGETK